MSGCGFLAESFVKRNRAGHADVERADHANLWNDKIAVGPVPGFFTHTGMFIAKHQGHAPGKVYPV